MAEDRDAPMTASLAVALRRGALLAVPVAVALAVDPFVNREVSGTLIVGALVAGFVAMDAPAQRRAIWQAIAAPAIGAAAALGVLTSDPAWLAVVSMGLVGLTCGYAWAVSPRLAVGGLTVALSFLIAQGIFLPTGDALRLLALATAGALMQATWSALVALALRQRSELPGLAPTLRKVGQGLRANLSPESGIFRHAIRFGLALAAGVVLYRALDLSEHGYWIPLTIAFVLRPDPRETHARMIERAIGTIVGLFAATGLAEAFGHDHLLLAISMTIAAAFSYALLMRNYGLFTFAITPFIVLSADLFGQNALDAVEERALGTALGLVIVAFALAIWAFTEPRTARRAA